MLAPADYGRVSYDEPIGYEDRVSNLHKLIFTTVLQFFVTYVRGQ